jgi:hypothetical protein
MRANQREKWQMEYICHWTVCFSPLNEMSRTQHRYKSFAVLHISQIALWIFIRVNCMGHNLPNKYALQEKGVLQNKGLFRMIVYFEYKSLYEYFLHKCSSYAF